VNIKLDENLPERLVSKLQALGHDVDTVRSEHLAGRDDNEVWQAAQAAGRFLITQDLDFSDDARVARVAMLFATEHVDRWRGCLVVATGHKVRVKRPV
jgi:predicted nuclease of predicted toxin-antitoxin system